MTPAPREGMPSAKLEHCIEVAHNDGWQIAAEQARAELTALLSEADAARAALEDAIRTWTFDHGQRHTHSWHDREDWFERHEAARKIRTALAAQDRAKETTK